MIQNVCPNCKWYEDSGCTNPRSIYENAFVRRYDSCDKWEEMIDSQSQGIEGLKAKEDNI